LGDAIRTWRRVRSRPARPSRDAKRENHRAGVAQPQHGALAADADNASLVPPEDVAELAQSTGSAIYMISTRASQLEPISSTVFERMTAATGGKAYFARNWKDEELAFASIRDDLAHLYSLSYYPRPNPNRGWRAITIKLAGDQFKKDHIRTRNGYRLQPARSSASAASTDGPGSQ
jgi:hypothetical protein